MMLTIWDILVVCSCILVFSRGTYSSEAAAANANSCDKTILAHTGETVTLTCSFPNAELQEAQFMWWFEKANSDIKENTLIVHGNTMFSQDERKVRVYSPEGENYSLLILSKIDAKHSGKYSCHLESDRYKQRTFNVKVEEPKFKVVANYDRNTRQNLACNVVSGANVCSLTYWQKRNNNNRTFDFFKMGAALDGTKNFGLFKCVVDNFLRKPYQQYFYLTKPVPTTIAPPATTTTRKPRKIDDDDDDENEDSFVKEGSGNFGRRVG